MQTGYWTTNLLDATLQANGDELTFPVTDRQVEGGRDWAPRRYPFRNGQSDEDTGARPRRLSYTVPLFRDVEEDHYPNLFNDLVEFFESDDHLGRATLTDPEFGPLPVRLVSYAWATNAKQRDGGELQLVFETLGDENFVLLTIRGGSDGDATSAVEDADEVDTALADSGKTPKESATKMKDAKAPITEDERLALGLSATFSANIGLSAGVNIAIPTIPALPSFTTSVTSTTGFGSTTVDDDEVRIFTALVQRFEERISDGTIVTSDEIGAELDVLLTRIASVRDDEDLRENADRGYPVLRSTSRLLASVQRVAERAFRDAPLVVDYELPEETSAFEVAVRLFSDPARVQDIIDLNPSLSPDFIPKGTSLVVPLE